MSEMPGTAGSSSWRTKPRSGASCACRWSAKASRSTRPTACERGLIEAGTRRPDLVVLDLGLPDGDGVDLIRDLRTWSDVPVLVLSARTGEDDKIEALDAGADDYLVKPFGAGELLARVRAHLRRRAGGVARQRVAASSSAT